MSASSALRAGRALAESLMVDTCTVTRGGAQVYAGRCRVQAGSFQPNTDIGLQGFTWNVTDALVQLPAATVDLLDGDTLTVTRSALNAHLVGRTYRVRSTLLPKTHETKRTVICTLLSETFLGDSIVVLRAPVVTDAYGNRVLDWANATSSTLLAQVQPLSSSESLGSSDRDQVVTRYEVWVGPEADVLARDRIQYGGLTLAVDGEPLLVKDTSGHPHHKTFTMTDSKG